MKVRLMGSLLASACILGFVGSAWAGGGSCAEGGKAKFLKEQLSLSDEQSTKVEGIFKNAYESDSCKDIDPSQDKGECWIAKRARIKEELSTVLSAEQFAKYESLRKERGFHKGKHRRGETGEK